MFDSLGRTGINAMQSVILLTAVCMQVLEQVLMCMQSHAITCIARHKPHKLAVSDSSKHAEVLTQTSSPPFPPLNHSALGYLAVNVN